MASPLAIHDIPDPLLEVERRLREEFQRNRSRRSCFSCNFDQLHAVFQIPGISWLEIGKRLSPGKPLRVQHVGKLYHRYVEPLERAAGRHNLSGYARYMQRVHTRTQEKVRELPDGQRKRVLGRVAVAAEEAGLTVHQILSEGCPDGLRSWALKVEGFTCMVHHLTRCAPLNGRGTRRYARVQFLRVYAQPYDAHIVYIDVEPEPRILVIPSFVLQRCQGRTDHIAGWVPVEGSIRRITKATKVDWLKYENAWHLLDAEEVDE